MSNTVILLLGCLLATPHPIHAIRLSDPVRKSRPKTVWLTASSLTPGAEYYLEVALDGRAVVRENNVQTIITRRGTLPLQLIKDFIREAENSEVVVNKHNIQDKVVFRGAEVIKLSAYINGELTLTDAPLDNFGEAFVYALRELRKAAKKLKADPAVVALLRAEQLVGNDLDAFRRGGTKDRDLKTVETSDVNRIQPLMASLQDAHRLIPVESLEEVQALRAFVTRHHLAGQYELFYLPSTRGTFKCSVLPAEKRMPAEPKNKISSQLRRKDGRKQ